MNRWILLIFLCDLLLSACTVREATRAPETEVVPGVGPTAVSTRLEATVPVQSSPETSPVPQATGVSTAPAACDPVSQEVSMRPGQSPDWPALGLVACYELSLQIPVEATTYSGAVRVTYTNLTGMELSDLVFRLYPNSERIYGGELSVSSVSVDGVRVDAEVILSDRTGLHIPLVEPLAQGASTVVELVFSGKVPTSQSSRPAVYGIFNFDPEEEILTLANWYPILAHRENNRWEVEEVSGIGDAVVSGTALYHVQVQAPEGWQVITTGTALDPAPGAGGASHEFVSGPARDFTVVAGPNFSIQQVEAGGVQVRHWGLPDGEPRWDEALQAAVNSLALFDQRFGTYPYAELEVVSVPLWLAAGVEYPGLVLMREGLYQPDDRSPFLLGLVVSHEVAHQWWYGVVGNDVLEDPWQDEALATFSSLLYQQEHQPEVYAGTLRFYEGQVAELERSSDETGIAQPVEAFQDNPGDYSPVVYLKGALFFVELRKQLGDEDFFKALGSYYAENRFEIASPEELLEAFEGACGCPLNNLYAEWGVE